MSLKLDGLNIKDKVTLGVGYKDVITDDEPVHVIWPGKNGNGISRIDKAYRYDSVSTRTTAYLESVNDWLPTRNDAGHGGEYVYTRITTVYTSIPTTVEYTVEYVPQDGASGTAIPYTFRGEWEPSTDYYHNGQRVDIVKVTSDNSATYYICTETGTGINGYHTSGSTFASDLALGYWEEFEGEYENIATGFLFAETGLIQNLKVAELATSDDTTKARITINENGSVGNGNNAIHGYDSTGTLGLVVSANTLQGLTKEPYDIEIVSGFGGIYPCINSYYTSEQDFEQSGINPGGSNYLQLSDNYTGATVTVTGTIEWEMTKDSGNWPTSQDLTSELHLIIYDVNQGDPVILADLGPVCYFNETISQSHYVGSIPINLNVKGNGYIYSGTRLAIVPLDANNNFQDPQANNLSLKLNFQGSIKLKLIGKYNSNTQPEASGIAPIGITLAPNGIRVFFDADNYFEFVQKNNKIHGAMFIGGENKLT